jgi:hypothetical protein
VSERRELATNPEPHAAVVSGALEWELLLASVAGEPGEASPSLRALSQKPVRWDVLFRLADDHGVSSLLYRNLSLLPGVVPAVELAILRREHETNIRKSLVIAGEMMRILDCLDAAGIETIPYKGVATAEIYYGDMALRRSGDIDLFVRRRDALRAKNAVRKLAYVPRVPIPDAAEENYIASGYEYTFDCALGTNLLELKWALEPRYYAVDFDVDGLFDRAGYATVAGRRVRTPSPEDLLLVLSVHAAKHVWGRLIWLCDIAQILQWENLNWDEVQSQARELGVERILRITLLLANHFLGIQIPGAMRSATLSDTRARAFVEKIGVAVAAGTTYGEQQISYFRLMMGVRERLSDRLRFFTRLAFTPGPGEWEAVRLPKSLFPLYRLVRMGRLAARLLQESA